MKKIIVITLALASTLFASNYTIISKDGKRTRISGEIIGVTDSQKGDVELKIDRFPESTDTVFVSIIDIDTLLVNKDVLVAPITEKKLRWNTRYGWTEGHCDGNFNFGDTATVTKVAYRKESAWESLGHWHCTEGTLCIAAGVVSSVVLLNNRESSYVAINLVPVALGIWDICVGRSCLARARFESSTK
jgi:hypothetical protein